MGSDRRKEIERHLTEEDLDEKLREAEDEHRLRRIGFVKNLYRGDTIAEAADREGRSESTGDRWADAWNEGGLDGLMPSFGGGRPPKLNDREREELLVRLRDGQPWTAREIRRLIGEEFDVEYSPKYVGEFLRDLGLTYRNPGEEASPRPDDGAERPDESDDVRAGDRRMGDGDEGWVIDDDVSTDGGTVGRSRHGRP